MIKLFAKVKSSKTVGKSDCVYKYTVTALKPNDMDK